LPASTLLHQAQTGQDPGQSAAEQVGAKQKTIGQPAVMPDPGKLIQIVSASGIQRRLWPLLCWRQLLAQIQPCAEQPTPRQQANTTLLPTEKHAPPRPQTHPNSGLFPSRRGKKRWPRSSRATAMGRGKTVCTRAGGARRAAPAKSTERLPKSALASSGMAGQIDQGRVRPGGQIVRCRPA